MRPWFEDYPEQFQRERVELEALGLVLDEELLEAGRVVYRGAVQVEGMSEPVELVVSHPERYPIVRPEVYAPNLSLGRHQNPFRGNLCLLDRSTREWDSDHSTAWLLRTQLPHLLRLVEEGGDSLREGEVQQGEPASTYFNYEPGVVVLVDEPTLQIAQEHRAGAFKLAVGQGQALMSSPYALSLVTSAPAGRHQAGEVLALLGGQLRERFPKDVVEGSWVRLDDLFLPNGEPATVLQAIRHQPGFTEPRSLSLGAGRTVRFYAAVAREEIRHEEYGDAWMFVVETTSTRQERGGKALVRGQRYTALDLTARIPSLAGMSNKTVALFGLGAIGAQFAVDLAKTLVGHLRILDHDYLDAGNTVRWPVGIPMVGAGKMDGLHGFISHNWPLTRTSGRRYPLGNAPPPEEIEGTPPESEVINSMLDGADILVDATAEMGIQQVLAEEADDRGLPQVYLTMSEGGWGGYVARVVPGVTGCWLCLQYHFADKSIPLPPRDASGPVQPRGCGFPTFTGSSFDALPVIAQGLRVVTHTLLHGRQGGDEQQDVFVLAQRPNADGSVLAPCWQSYPLEPHHECPLCTPETE